MSQPAARLGDICTGHGCYPSRRNISASQNVFINGIPAHRVGDVWEVHCCGDDCHGGTTVTGSGSVFINNRQAARVGDVVNCGSRIASGSNNVFIG